MAIRRLYNILNILNYNKQLLNNVIGSFIIKGLAVLVNILIMPAYMSYFPDHLILGLWFSLVSILSWILSFDLGIGNGLRNNLVQVLVERKDLKAKQYISSAYIIIGVITACMMIIGYLIIGLINWNHVFNISSDSISLQVLFDVIRFMFLGVLIQFFLKLILSILNALQKTAISNLVSLISNVLLLIYIFIFNSGSPEENLVNLALVNILSLNIPLAVATIVVFSTTLKIATPNINYYVKDYAYDVIKLGGTFFWIQISFVMITSTNEFLIAWLYGPAYVVEYQVYYKIFYLIVTLFSLITNPVWSAITKAYAENRLIWIKKMGWILHGLAFLGAVAGFAIIPFLPLVVDYWLGSNAIHVNPEHATIFAAYSAIMLFILATTCLANGMGKLNVQLICNTLAAVLKIPIAFVLSKIFTQWTSVMLTNILLMLPCAVIQIVLIQKHLKKKKEVYGGELRNV